MSERGGGVTRQCRYSISVLRGGGCWCLCILNCWLEKAILIEFSLFKIYNYFCLLSKFVDLWQRYTWRDFLLLCDNRKLTHWSWHLDQWLWSRDQVWDIFNCQHHKLPSGSSSIPPLTHLTVMSSRASLITSREVMIAANKNYRWNIRSILNIL